MSQKIKKKRHCTLTRGRKIAEKDKAMFCTRKCTLTKQKKMQEKGGAMYWTHSIVLYSTLTLDKIGGNVQCTVQATQWQKWPKKRLQCTQKDDKIAGKEKALYVHYNKMTKNSRKSD